MDAPNQGGGKQTVSSLHPALEKIRSGECLSESEAAAAITEILEGRTSEGPIGAFLMGLAQRGESAAEIAGAARVLRAKAQTIHAPANAVDCCGTGGDRAGTYNISTAAAFVAAACGVPVAKHGNRASSSKSGAADVLEALGVALDLPEIALEESLRTLGFCFLMAPRHHAAMKHVAAVRKQLGFRTLFNLLGPLANPAGVRRQLVGVPARKWIDPMAQALVALGAERAWIVHGSDGLDEITVTGETHVAVLDNGALTSLTLSPSDFGLATAQPDSLIGGGAAENAAALLDIFGGRRNAYRDATIANAAALLMIDSPALEPAAAADRAARAIDGGAAADVLERYTTFSKENAA